MANQGPGRGLYTGKMVESCGWNALWVFTMCKSVLKRRILKTDGAKTFAYYHKVQYQVLMYHSFKFVKTVITGRQHPQFSETITLCPSLHSHQLLKDEPDIFFSKKKILLTEV